MTDKETIRVKHLNGTKTKVDIYWPDTNEPAPLVIVAHGFWRNRRTMSGWGQHLADVGFVATIPDLPAWSNHARNGHFISLLKECLSTNERRIHRIDSSRVGLMGFSAGGLASLLAAAESPDVSIWVGLDPVDWNGLGVQAAPSVKCHTTILTADPSSCNAYGNARDLVAALPGCEHVIVPGAVHVDAEWPTDWMAEIVCGRSTEENRGEFCHHATTALVAALGVSPMTSAKNSG